MKYRNASDKELIDSCKDDDVRAYNELFDRYAGKLYRHGIRLLKDETIVEELAMDILLNLWDRRKELCLEGSLSAYLFKAMHNRVISQLRKCVPVMVDIESVDENNFAVDSATDQQVILKDAEYNYHKLLLKLSPQRQIAFRLSREEGLSYTDIAEKMNLSPNTVKNHINAALDFLRHHHKSITYLFLFGLCTAICCL